MATDIDYAALSARVYKTVRSDENTNPVPNGWNEVFYQSSSNPLSGLTAGVYVNPTNNEIVIAFKGLDPGLDGLNDYANIVALASGGAFSPQLTDAVSLYLNYKNDPAYSGMTISFTGHSLGGGIASVMGVWFDKPAVVFDRHVPDLSRCF